MFKLVALLFLVTSPEQPVHAMTYNQSSFPTKEACEEFFVEDDDGRIFSRSMKMMAMTSGLVVKLTCLEAKDNTI